MTGLVGLRAPRAAAPAQLRLPAEAILATLVEQVPGILYVAEIGLVGRWLYLSPQVEALLGWTPQEWMADPSLFFQSIHPDDRHVEEGADQQTPPGGRHTSEYRLMTRGGRYVWVRDDATLMADELGRPVAWSGVLTDITEQRQAQQKLRRSDERTQRILETALDAYVSTDAEGVILDWNRAAELTFGWTREEVVGVNLVETIIPERFRSRHLEALRLAATDQVIENPATGRTLELEAVCRDGRELPIELTLWRTIDEGCVRFSAFVRDIAERTDLQAQLTSLAYHDSETGLGNRALFSQQVAEAVADPGAGFAVLMIGLDDLRSVRDSLGHAAADEVIRAVSHRLRASVPGSARCARFSDNELAVLLVRSVAASDAQGVAEAFQDTLGSPVSCAGTEITVRASIGVRQVGPDPSAGAEELLSDAGVAMQAAAGAAHKLTRFEKRMRAERLRRLQLSEALEQAVERGEITVHYQPYFAFADGHCIGVEALARWRHPVHGQVPPSEFIPLAESTGRIKSIGLHVLARACEDIAGLRAAHDGHADLGLSVNLSARQLVDTAFGDALGEVLSRTGLPGHALTLELTETALVENADDVAERLADIRAMQVHLAVDDFGTRYASLAYLQRFPIDTLKVDRSFVRRMHESTRDHQLTGAIITMAKSLGLRTIAEGIEEEEHAVRLSALGCDAGQGFLLARPVELSALTSQLGSAGRRFIKTSSGSTTDSSPGG